jgi:hypothetical protein
MGIDEEGTLAALKAYRREIIDPKIAGNRQRKDCSGCCARRSACSPW